MSINLTVVVDNDEAIRRFRQLQQVAKTSTSNIVSDTDRMDMAMRRLGTAIGSLGLGFSLQQLGRQIATVRGEFQQLEVAFTTMLGSKAEADMLMSRTVEFAAKTPFDLQGVANGTKQLLAYGSNASEVTDELRMLGDIAAGLSMPLGDLVYLYGTTRTQGRMFTMDLRQFMGRGIPLAEELAKQFGVTKSQVSELVTEGKVGFEDMKNALVSMTSEGGKFYNLMEEQSKTITGKLSNLGDAVQQMFNNIGKESEDAISKTIEGASYLVENYEKVGRVLMDIVALYGSYKAAVMLINAVMRVRASLLAAETLAVRANAIAHTDLTAATTLLTKAMKALNLTALSNPYVLAGAAIAAATFGIYKWITAKSDEEKAIERVNKRMEEYNDKQSELQQKASEDVQVMKDANATSYDRVRAYNALIQAYPELLQRYDEEKIKLMEVAELNREISGITNDRRKQSLQGEHERLQNEINRLNERDSYVIDGKRYYDNPASKRKVERLEADKKAVESQLRQVEKEERQAEFDALPTDDKIKHYKAEIEALDGRIQRLTSEVENADNVRKGEVNQELKAAKSMRDEYNRRIETLKKTLKTEKPMAEDDEVGKARLKAQEAANKAEIELQKAHLDDKALLLTFEKEQALKALDERYKTTNDAETRAAIERERAATEALYDKQIDDALHEDVLAFAHAEQEKADKEKETLNELLEKYNMYTRSRKAIEKSFNDDIEALENSRTESNSAMVDSAIAEAKRQMEEALADFDLQELGGSNLFVKLFTDAAEMTSKHLKSIIADTRKLVNYLDGTSTDVPLGFTQEQLDTLKKQPDQIKAIYDALIEKQDELDSRTEYPFSNIIKGLKMLKEAHEQATKAAKATTKAEKEAAEANAGSAKGKAMDYLKEGALQAAEGVSFLAGKMGELAEVTDSESIKDMAESLEAAASFISDVAGGAAAGGWIGAAVGAATNLFSQMMNSFVQAEKSRQEFLNNERDFINGYQLLMLQLKEMDYDSIFGTDALGRAIDAYGKAQEALALYNKEVSASAKDFILDNLPHWWRDPSKNQEYLQFIDEYYGKLTKLQALGIKTRDRSAFAEFFGAEDEYTMLKDLRPQLWNDDGSFNVEEAKLFLETNTQINDEQRDLIQNVIDLKDQYDELIEEADQALESFLGDMAADLTDIIFDSIRNGTDAWDAFQDRGAEAINSLGKMMIQELFVKAYLDQYAEQLRDAFALGDVSKSSYKIAEIIDSMYDGMGEMMTGAMNAAQAWDAAAQEAGFDVSAMNDAAAQSATARGFQAMSQDTGDELNGRFTDIQGKVTDIRSFVIELMNTGKLHHAEAINIRDILLQLSGNVGDIRTFTQVLPEMRDAINNMNKKLDNL